MITGSKKTQVLLAVILGAAIAVVIFCVAIKLDIVDSSMLSTEFKPKGNTLEELANSVVKEVVTEDMNELQKYKVLHDWLINYAEYDWNNVNTSSTSIHNGTVVLTSGKGVCDAYAYAYQALCKSANLYCKVIIGNTGDKYSDHAWNIVRVNNQFYHVDCTWDDSDNKSLEKEQTYDYFMLSDKTMTQHGRAFETQGCNSTTYEGKFK